jgi:ligand-binding sensor domain-containing protein/two-component sensor histidine kinase
MVYIWPVRILLFQLCFLLCVANLFAQEPYFRHYGVEDGLPSSETYDLLQDTYGYIWITSDRGVSRYDSYTFRNFSTADGLTDNTVFFLEEDTAGRVWCATLNNKLCYFEGDRISPYRYNSSLASSPRAANVIQSIDVAGNGDVYIGRQQMGCVKMDSAGKMHVLPDTGNNLLPHINVYSDHHAFVFGSLRKSWTDKPQSVLISVFSGTSFSAQAEIRSGMDSYYTTALQKRDGSVLVAADNVVAEFSTDGTHKVHTFPGRVIRMIEDAEGKVWIGMHGSGVRCYNADADLSGTDYRVFLPSETITDVLQDREGSYWMTTLAHGVYFLGSANVHCLFTSSNLLGISVTSLAHDTQGKILVGTAAGWIIYDAAGSRQEINCNLYATSTDIVNDFYPDPATGSTWFCTASGIMNLSRGVVVKRVISGGMNRICADNAGGYWMGGHYSLAHFNPRTSAFDGWIVTRCMIKEMFYDSVSGKLLLGTLDGLYTPSADSLIRSSIADTLITDRIDAIDRLGDMLVLGTIGAGVKLIRNDSVITIGTNEGLCSPMVNDIDIDASGAIWAATTAGVARITVSGKKINVDCFSVYHGLPTNEVSCILCSGDTVWIGTSTGAAWFIPAQLEHAAGAPPIYLQEVLVNGQNFVNASQSAFAHDQNQVRFSFLGISYRNAGNTVYRYRLAGVDTAWTYTANRSVEFASLAPGDYRFEVMARSADGAWSAVPAVYTFSIGSPFWFTWWFWIAAAVLIAAIVLWIVHRKLQRVKSAARQRGVLAEYQHQALTAQMNPHFIFNSLSSMQAFILGDEKENALRYVDRFSFLMRRSLEYSMLKYITLAQEIDLLRAYFDLETMRFGDKMKYTISYDSSLDINNIEVPCMIVQPFAENAIRHGLLHRENGGGELTVTFAWKNEAMWCTVEDNGVGRKRSAEINRARKKHVSFGSSITEERLRALCEVMHQEHHLAYTDKTDAGGEPAGTTVYFLLPSRKRFADAESHSD